MGNELPTPPFCPHTRPPSLHVPPHPRSGVRSGSAPHSSSRRAKAGESYLRRVFVYGVRRVFSVRRGNTSRS